NSNGHMRPTALCGTLLDGPHAGPSIDAVLSRSPRVRQAGTTYGHVSAGIYGQNHSYFMEEGRMKEPFKYSDGKQLFNYLFADFTAPASDDAAELRRRKLLLVDSVLENYRQVARSPKLGGDDKRVLERVCRAPGVGGAAGEGKSFSPSSRMHLEGAGL
ncbi:MAG TPA: hypothetical protein VEY30_10375, partial [Myxococcaceae bacterium]|nr:hypothetical protein [Myxococcaceae bacterium]